MPWAAQEEGWVAHEPGAHSLQHSRRRLSRGSPSLVRSPPLPSLPGQCLVTFIAWGLHVPTNGSSVHPVLGALLSNQPAQESPEWGGLKWGSSLA